MEKAYDFKALLDSVKNELPEIEEETVKVVIKKLFPWLKESAVLSENKIDDMLAMTYPLIQDRITALAEDINKADNAITNG